MKAGSVRVASTTKASSATAVAAYGRQPGEYSNAANKTAERPRPSVIETSAREKDAAHGYGGSVAVT